MRPVGLVLVAGLAALALLTVATGYVVWIRLVGLDPTLAKRAAELPGHVSVPGTVLLGVGLGATFTALPSMRAGLAAVVMLASSTFAGLLLFELYAARQGYGA